jgi:hypothetical protein
LVIKESSGFLLILPLIAGMHESGGGHESDVVLSGRLEPQLADPAQRPASGVSMIGTLGRKEPVIHSAVDSWIGVGQAQPGTFTQS